MRRGALKRLTKRYVEFDRRKNNRLGVSGIIWMIGVGASILIPERLHFSDFAQRCIGIGCLILFSIALVWYWRRMVLALATQGALICRQCNLPLNSFALRRRTDHPDYRIDGEPPTRCPHCHVPIDDAFG